jgi:hypothetical protein
MGEGLWSQGICSFGDLVPLSRLPTRNWIGKKGNGKCWIQSPVLGGKKSVLRRKNQGRQVHKLKTTICTFDQSPKKARVGPILQPIFFTFSIPQALS